MADEQNPFVAALYGAVENEPAPKADPKQGEEEDDNGTGGEPKDDIESKVEDSQNREQGKSMKDCLSPLDPENPGEAPKGDPRFEVNPDAADADCGRRRSHSHFSWRARFSPSLGDARTGPGRNGSTLSPARGEHQRRLLDGHAEA